MLCSRCSHPLAPRADRCLRCFALNPQNRGTEPLPAPRAPARAEPRAGRFEFRPERPAAPYRAELSAEETVQQLDLSFEDLFDAAKSPGASAEEPTEPPEAPGAARAGPPAPSLARPPAASRPLAARPAAPPALAKATRAEGPELSWPTVPERLLASAIDAAALSACFALHVALAVAGVGVRRLSPGGPQSIDTWADLLLFARNLPLLWALLGACLALAYSWAFVAIAGRTPGMLLAGLRVVRLRRGRATRVPALRALVRAGLALPTLLCGAFSLVLALFDARGQALHDRLTGCRVLADGRALRAVGPRG